MKSSKRLLSVILAFAVLLVSLPMTFAVGAADLPDALTGLVEGETIKSYDFSKYDLGALPDGFVYGASRAAQTPALSFGYGNADSAASYASVKEYNSAKYLCFNSVEADALLLAPAITETNYVYEATFIMTSSGANVGISNLSWGDAIEDVASAQWFVVRNAKNPSIWGKATTAMGGPLTEVTDLSTYQPKVNDTVTLKLISYEGTNYYFIDGEYVTSADQGYEGTTGGRVGFYTYGGTMYISSMSVKTFGAPEEIDYWDGTFKGALPTTDADGDGEIEITTPEQFAAVASSTGLDADGNRIKYELTKDIWLNNTAQENWKDTATPWIDPVTDISTATVFNGIINGNGYVVRGMYINTVYEETNANRTAFSTASGTLAEDSATEVKATGNIYAGLFPVIGKGAGIIGIGVEDAYISVTDSCQPITLADGKTTMPMNRVGSVGAIVGTVADSGSDYAVIDRCYADESVYIQSAYAGLVGGIPYTTNIEISNSYALCSADVFKGTTKNNDANNDFQFVAGAKSGGYIHGCYTFGNVTNNGCFIKNTAGQDINTDNYTTTYTNYNNVYYTRWANPNFATRVSADNMKGSAAKTNMPNLDWELFSVTDSYPALNIFTTHTQARGVDVWDGSKTDSSATDTDGDNYVEVYTAEQLAYVINNSVSAELMNDIWLNDISVYAKGGFYINNMNRAANIWLNKEYKADFNGNGNVVHGVFYNTAPVSASSDYSGLIPGLVKNQSVVKVGVEDSYIRNNSNYSIGAVVGYFGSDGTKIDRCYAGETVYVEGYSGVGGITGGGSDSGQSKTITNTYSLATVKGSSAGDGRVGGIVGNYWNSNVYTIKYCYTDYSKIAGNITRTTTVKGNYATVEENGICTGVSREDMMGDSALSSYTVTKTSDGTETVTTCMSELNGDGAYVTTMGFPILRIFDEDYIEEEKVGEVWNGSIAADYEDGTGTSTDPYIISKGSQLARAINLFGQDGAYYKLDRDIYLNDIKNFNNATNSWFSGVVSEKGYYAYDGKVVEENRTSNTGAFNGHIDGNGFHVYGLNYTDDASQASGLIPIMAEGSVKNLGLDYANITAGSYDGTEGAPAGVIIGRSDQSGMIYIDSCYVGENITFENSGGRGGIIGYATQNSKTSYVAISNSYVLMSATLLPSDSAARANAFIGMVWNTYYTLENAWSVARPLGTKGSSNRTSQFYVDDTSKMGDYLKNVFTCTADPSGNYEVAGDVKAFTRLDDSQMRGSNVFNYMTVNGDGAFVYNIGYPSLAVFGQTVPEKNTLKDGYSVPETVGSAEAIPTIDYVYTATFTAPSEAVTVDNNRITVTVNADGTVTATDSATTKSATVTLGETVKVEIYHISGFYVVYVNDTFVALFGAERTAGDTVTVSVDATVSVEYLIAQASFDGVDHNVDIQLKDFFGNNIVGGIRFNTTLTESDVIEDLGYDVEYGTLVSVSEKIIDDITIDNAQAFVFNSSSDRFEITGLSGAKQELFFAIRGYAKITSGDFEYYYYADDTSVYCPIYEANDLYENAAYAEDIEAVYGDSDKFITKLTQELDFTLFADYHYVAGVYTSQLSDLKNIVERADENGSDFIFSLGDMSNDMAGSKEITNYLLNGTWTDADGTVENTHNYAFYNIYGNHELEFSNTMQYVNSVLTNSEVHWGDGSVGSVSASTLSGNATQKELEASSYYWYEVNGIRIICINTNFSWNPNHINGEVVGWEHNLKGSYGRPTAADNAARGFDEGAAALANIKGDHLGDVQLAWLEATLMDAVEKGVPCIVMGHNSVSGEFGNSSAGDEVRALYAKANAIRTGTVIASFNGHLHTNRQEVVDGVLYLDINTVRNSWWQGGNTEEHYGEKHTFSYDTYVDGVYVSSETKSLTKLTQSKNTWFANGPVSCNIKVTQTGTVTVDGVTSSWMYNVVPTEAPDYAQPEITSGSWSVGDASFNVAQ